MDRWTVEEVAVEGFASIEKAVVQLRAVNVLIGANGAGKSNFLRALELLGRMADRQLQSTVTRWGGAGTLTRMPSNREMRFSVAGHGYRFDARIGSLVEEFDLDDLIIVDRVDGSSSFTRPDRDQLVQWLDDYSVGDLWRANLLGGRPASEAA